MGCRREIITVIVIVLRIIIMRMVIIELKMMINKG
jgi:hypothetical protein